MSLHRHQQEDCFSYHLTMYSENSNKKITFQWDAYRPLVDLIPTCTAEGVYLRRGCTCPGVYLPGGVPAKGGCTCPGGCICQGGTCQAGVPAQAVYLPGGGVPGGCTCQGVYLPGGVPGEVYPSMQGGSYPPVNRMTDRQV